MTTQPAMNGSDVRQAAAQAAAFLGPQADGDWSRNVPGLDFTVASVVAHAAEGPLWYAVDLTGGPGDDGAFEVRVRPDADPQRLLASMRTAAELCAMAVDGAPGTARGYHPAGPADPSGFAGMACDEILIHTYDAGTGLGERFSPDAGLAARLLRRLFPWVDAGSGLHSGAGYDPGSGPGANAVSDAGAGPRPDPWEMLLWANGRIDLPGRPRQVGWRWHCAPLAEWNGQPPAPVPPAR